MKNSHDVVVYICGLIAVIGIISASYLYLEGEDKDVKIENLLQERNTLLQKNNQKDADLIIASTTIAELQVDLEKIKDDLDDLADNYRNEKNRNEDFESQIRNLSGTLDDLDKLAKIDKELLAKYSKVYFLNENYVPKNSNK